jgi:hypothetical protein
MRKTNKSATSGKRPTGRQSGSTQQGPNRSGKERALSRLRQDTLAVNGSCLLSVLKKQGYEELPLEEIQDRLSKLRTALAEFIVSRRG